MSTTEQPDPWTPAGAETTTPVAGSTAPAAEPAPGAPASPAAETAPDPVVVAATEAPAAAEPAVVDEAPPDIATAGVAAPAQAAPAPQARSKTKGVADIVFVVDVSGSMATCIDALRGNIEAFVDSLSRGDANNAAPVRDWRAKVVGYRDLEAAESEGLPWIVDHPSCATRARSRRSWPRSRRWAAATSRKSLLDALYKVASMEASPKGSQTVDPAKWRYRSDAARVVIVFTDASFKETMSLPEARGGSLQDVANLVMANRVILSLFAPNFEGYDRLSQIDRSEWEVVEFEGLSPQEALRKFTSDPANFRTTLKQLAASVSRSAETVAL
jgi:hypothetical protein